MAAIKNVSALVFAMALAMLTGCQTYQPIVSAPTFDAPVLRPPVSTAPGAAIPRVQIPSIQGPLLKGGALTPRVPARNWKYIIIHHSDTAEGSAARFDLAHKRKGWDMLGYDFVIGNGSETRDGLIEVGPRWTLQMRGAHTGTPNQEYNDHGVGICLVGNFEITRPTARQMDSLARLCAYLMKTYHIPANRILRHGDCKPTDCPGRNVNMGELRARATAYYRSGVY